MATTTADLPSWLVSGDRLSRREFERRYATMPANIKGTTGQVSHCTCLYS